jgi:oxalate---CoA ligase
VETTQPNTAVLPSSLDAFAARWEIVEKSLVAPSWDFMWSGSAEEGREKQLVQEPFILNAHDIPESVLYTSDNIFVADAALKVRILATFVDRLTSNPYIIDDLGHS